MTKANTARARMMPKAAPAYDENTKFIGGFEITKLVREHVPIVAGEGFESFGKMLDAQLEETAMRGEEVQSVTFEINPEAWQTFASEVNRVRAEGGVSGFNYTEASYRE